MTAKFADYLPGADRDGGAGRGVSRPATGDLTIRYAREADLKALAAIAAEREGEPIERWLDSFRRLLRECESGAACVLVAEVRADVVGFGKVARFTPPEGSPANTAPAGWYLSGVVVAPAWRRQGIGARITAARLAWIAERANKAHYFANARNQVSIDLHRSFGFSELSRDFHHPHATFEGGIGILFVCELRPGAPSPPTSRAES